MIKQNIEYGNIIIPTLAQFGKGDIAVAFGKNIDHVAVVFQNQSPREIGSEGDLKKGQSTNDTHPELIMVFDDENSIDVIVKALLIAKEELHDILIG